MAIDHMEVAEKKAQAVIAKVIGDLSAAAGVELTLLGIRTGLWEAMAGAGPTSPGELAARTGTTEAYAAE